MVEKTAVGNMIRSIGNFRHERAVVPTRAATHFDQRLAFERFYDPNEHQRPEMTVRLVESGSEIRYAIPAAGRSDLGAQHVGVFEIILFAFRNFAVGRNFKPPALFIVEERTEDEAAVKTRPALPNNIGLVIDVCEKTAVPDDPVWINVTRALHS